MTDTPNSWRYSVRIPSWSQIGSSGEPTVFYQLEVTVLPPHGGPPKVRSLARRFSNFLSLYSRLKEELSSTTTTTSSSSTTTTPDLPPPPPKRSFTNVNKSPVLIEQRRRDLESWMWRLIQRPDVANSVMMAHFCELDAASRIITTTNSSKGNDTTITNRNDNEDDEYELSRSNVARMFSTTASQASSSSYHSDDHHHHHHQQSPVRTGQSPPYSIVGSVTSSSKMKGQQKYISNTNTISSSMENKVRPAFHIQKRAELQHLVGDLSKKLHIATTDLHDAVRTIHGNEEAMKILADQVDELIREREEEKEEEEEEEGGEEERKNAADEDDADIEEEKAVPPTTTYKEDESSSLTNMIQRLKQQVIGLESQVELKTTELRDKEVEVEGMRREVEAGNEMATALRAELGKVTEMLEVERKERKEDGERSRGELKVLAREIKTLRLQVVEMEKEKERRKEEESLGGGVNAAAPVGDTEYIYDDTHTNGGPVSLI